MKTILEAALTTSDLNQSLIFFTLGRAETKPGMKRSRSAKKSTMYKQKTLKNRKMVGSMLQTKAGAGAHETKEENFVGDIKPANSLTMSKERRATMSKLIKHGSSVLHL